MSDGRVTMKDIAQRVGVSINTVHKAIAGKPGVSEVMRAKILDCARELGYQRNAAASNLSRKAARIVVCLPSPVLEGSFYFSYLWKGIDRCREELRDTVVSFSEVPYAIGGYAACLRNVLFGLKSGNTFEGLVAYVPADDECAALLLSIAQEGVAIELVDGDYDLPGRLGSVVANYGAAGCIMAEQAANLLLGKSGAKRILLLAGDKNVESHAEVAQAFHAYLNMNQPEVEIADLFGAHQEIDRLRTEVSQRLGNGQERPDLVCSVFAVGSEVLSDAIMELGLTGEMPAIGSDLFPENVEALRRGIFSNVVYKDPIGMAYRAATAMSDFLLWGTKPDPEVYRGPVDLVFRSNLSQYCRLMGIEG